MLKFPGFDTTAEPLLRAMAACRQYIMQAAVFSAFLNLLYLAPTLYMLQVYDRVVPTRGVVTLLMLTLIFVLAVCTLSALDLVRARLLVRAGMRLDQLLSGSILDALLRTSKTSSMRSAAMLREFDIFRQTMTGVGVLALFDAPWSPIYILVCFFLHPALGALALVGSLILVLLAWLNERATNQPLKDANAAANMAYTGIDSTLQSAGVVQALGMREVLVRRHLRERLSVSDTQSHASFQSAGYMSMTKAARLLLQSLALGLGAFLAIEQQISPGAIFAASLLVSRALQPIELLTSAWKNMIQARAAYRSLVELYDARGPIRIPTTLPPAVGKIEVSRLGVLSPARDRLLINDVSFRLDPGETLGIVGPSGAGKSTLIKAMVGALPIHGGAVRVDGASLSDWPEEQLAASIGYVPQEPTLFRGTIKENIARFNTELGDVGAFDEEVIRAAQLCGAHDFILRLPQGYDTALGWHGAGLSAGQAQRIALARALFGNPSMVIMDEPNASLDAEGEAQLVRAMTELKGANVTVVVVAHRTGILSSVDKLLVMQDGRVDQFGTRAAVLARLSAPPANVPQTATAAE
jgi:ATP-binding cassette subfamily C protein